MKHKEILKTFGKMIKMKNTTIEPLDFKRKIARKIKMVVKKC